MCRGVPSVLGLVLGHNFHHSAWNNFILLQKLNNTIAQLYAENRAIPASLRPLFGQCRFLHGFFQYYHTSLGNTQQRIAYLHICGQPFIIQPPKNVNKPLRFSFLIPTRHSFYSLAYVHNRLTTKMQIGSLLPRSWKTMSVDGTSQKMGLRYSEERNFRCTSLAHGSCNL